MANRGLLLLGLIAGCPETTDKGATTETPDTAASGGSGGDDGSGGSSGGGSGSGSGGGEDTSVEVEDSAAPTGDSGADEETGEPTEPDGWTLRFVALGDSGEGNDAQYLVAAAIESVCAVRGCEFALLLGDNIYESGVDSVDDEQFQEKFELPYAYLEFPFYVALGNHDYGGGGAGYEWWKADYQVEYTDHSDKWTMPDTYYSFAYEDVDFFAIDSNAIFWGSGGDQQTWLADEMAAATGTWKIVFGHHPYISNGTHGNAGNYEGLDWIPIVNGENVETFMEESVCGQADIYICGHDHDRQWLESTCGTEFVVSGAGAKTTEIVERDGNATYFQEATTGFLWVEVTAETFTGVFYDDAGTEQFSRTFYR